MSSIEPVQSPLETDSISIKQPLITFRQNSQTDSVSVKIESPKSGSEKPTNTPSVEIKQRAIPKPLYILFCCFLCVCLSPLAYAFVTVLTVASLLLLMVGFVLVRLFQIIVSAENYEKRFITVHLLRYWIFVVVMLLLVEVGLFYPIAKYVPGLKSVLIIGLPITKWINLICILIGIYVIGQVIWGFICFIVANISLRDEPEGWCFIVMESVIEIADCLLDLWANAVVMSSVPTFKQIKIYGIYAQKWINVSLFLLIGYNVITVLAHLFVWSLPKYFRDHPGIGEPHKTALEIVLMGDFVKRAFNKKYVVYAIIGTKRSVVFILSMLMLLITWVLYFGNHINTTPEDKKVLEFGTWTFVSLLICSFLWLIKCCILLYWEARSVYDRLHDKVTAIGKQLYFCILLTDDKPPSNDTDCESSSSKTPIKKKLSWYREELIKHIGRNASTYELQKAAELFFTVQYALPEEGIDADVLDHLQGNDSEKINKICQNKLKDIVKGQGEDYFDEDWEMLLHLLPDVKTEKDITLEKVKIFMERTRSSCMFLSNTFISVKEVVKCLNQVMSGIIIAATFIMWLLLTGLASTKVLVLIASPALAATFIFGDTAKGLFQGLIFVYVVHPFDVGDLCLIDGELLEVVRISVWCTTFSYIRTIGEQQQVIYPNSMLSQKNIVNHKCNFNWNDQVEFLCTPDKRITEPLRQEIDNYLKKPEKKIAPNFHSVEIREIGDKAKIVVHIKYKLPTTVGWTKFECLKEKEKRRYELAVELHHLMKQLESPTETPESAGNGKNIGLEDD